MAKVYLGLGANLGDRRANLEAAITRVAPLSLRNLRVSSVYENPALLKPGSPPEWNKCFLNCVVEIEVSQVQPRELLRALKEIELALGRLPNQSWQPRPIDIDIIYWEGCELQSEDLQIPHSEMIQRSFVLNPLSELAPALKISGTSVLELARKHPQHAPRWMGILNLTPDSFSEKKEKRNIAEVLDSWDEHFVSIIDVGGESTRPGAVPVDPEQEWQRVGETLQFLQERYREKHIKPQISIDTRHAQVAARAVEAGANILNDVSGFTDAAMLEVASSCECELVVMHSLSVPADPQKILPTDRPVSLQVYEWMGKEIDRLTKAGIKKERLIFDPGIGFGKNTLQSIELLQNVDKLHEFGFPLLVGHSRKSFLAYRDPVAATRDMETIGASLALIGKGVQILRVHTPDLHLRAALAWNHLR